MRSWGGLGSVLKASWRLLASLGVLLGGSWAALGRSLARLGEVLGPLGEKGGPRGRGTALNVNFWTPFWRGLGGSGHVLGAKRERREEKRQEKEKKGEKVKMLRKACVLRVGFDVGVVR